MELFLLRDNWKGFFVKIEIVVMKSEEFKI